MAFSFLGYSKIHLPVDVRRALFCCQFVLSQKNPNVTLMGAIDSPIMKPLLKVAFSVVECSKIDLPVDVRRALFIFFF